MDFCLHTRNPSRLSTATGRRIVLPVLIPRPVHRLSCTIRTLQLAAPPLRNDDLSSAEWIKICSTARLPGQKWDPMLQLQIQYPDGRRDALDLKGDEWLIGRDESCEVPLDDAATSRRHARLYRDPQGRIWIQDLQSKNGTFLNERGISSAEITPRDRLAVGGCVMRVVIPDKPSIVLRDTAGSMTHATTNAWGRDQRVALAQRRLESLYELNERLTGRFDRDDLLSELLDICIDHLRFERAGVAVWSGESAAPPQWVLIRNLRDGADAEIHLSRSIVDRALHHGERILITDTS